MEDGHDRASRDPRPDDVLARYGLVDDGDGTPGGRASRRRVEDGHTDIVPPVVPGPVPPAGRRPAGPPPGAVPPGPPASRPPTGGYPAGRPGPGSDPAFRPVGGPGPGSDPALRAAGAPVRGAPPAGRPGPPPGPFRGGPPAPLPPRRPGPPVGPGAPGPGSLPGLQRPVDGARPSAPQAPGPRPPVPLSPGLVAPGPRTADARTPDARPTDRTPGAAASDPALRPARPVGARSTGSTGAASGTATPGAATRTALPDDPDDSSAPGRRRRRATATAGTAGERAEAAAGEAEEVRRIDETLTRLTAAHAGVTLARTDADAPAPTPEKVRVRPGVGQLLFAALALAVFAVTAFQYVGKARLDAAVTQVTALDPDSGAIVDADAQAGAENVLILGTEPADPAGGPPTDTVLLAHVPAGGGDVVGLSVPYDLEVNRPPCRRWDPAARDYLDETVPAQARTPLRTAFEVGGPQCVTRVVQQLTGLAVTRFVGLDLDGIGDLVDAVGGVDVCVEQPVVDGLLGAVVPRAGVTTLDGLTARDFVAARTVEGDPVGGRGVLERQQRLVAAVLEKTLSREVLLDPARIGSLGPALGGALSADDADLDRILATARSVRSFAARGVTFTTVPTAIETSGQGNTVLRGADAAALFTALREGTPLPDQTVLAAGAGPAPADVTVDVLNASDRQGLAAEIGGTLGTLGFRVDEIGNADETAPDTVIRFSPDRAAAAQLLAATVPSATTVPDPAASGVLQLVLGNSFDGVVRAPSTAAAATPAEPPAVCA
ncbi:hypothetical protein GCM10017691_01990 [Pseudonocardia petroleophila]|uniref:LCP family protein n=1 Tax=Pseudonocardia petroleophila TaxID=37331 RepID=A0A7G7ML58_9PSEU|nr:LCP family protein [Pseudonocardia petroleophila]QNG53519.1 LCP family protein [Pseudonocardia petroleophila]